MPLNKKSALAASVIAAATALFAGHDADAQIARRGALPRVNQPAVGGMVNLPYTTQDSQGNQWLFYNYGQFQHQGNMPIYSQGGMLQINGAYPTVRNNQAKIDEKTGEIIFENMTANGV